MNNILFNEVELKLQLVLGKRYKRLNLNFSNKMVIFFADSTIKNYFLNLIVITRLQLIRDWKQKIRVQIIVQIFFNINTRHSASTTNCIHVTIIIVAWIQSCITVCCAYNVLDVCIIFFCSLSSRLQIF